MIQPFPFLIFPECHFFKVKIILRTSISILNCATLFYLALEMSLKINRILMVLERVLEFSLRQHFLSTIYLVISENVFTIINLSSAGSTCVTVLVDK